MNTRRGRIIIAASIVGLLGIRFSYAENLEWSHPSENWVVFRNIAIGMCRAATRNDVGSVFDIRIWKGRYAIAITNVDTIEGERIEIHYGRRDGTTGRLVGVATSSSTILLEAKIEDLLLLIENGSVTFPYGGNFKLGGSKEAIVDAMECAQSLG